MILFTKSVVRGSTGMKTTRPSLESLIESEDLGLEVLHPGGLEITKELAELCKVREHTSLLDVAAGTGESACYLAQHFGCSVVGVDASEYMVERAARKAKEKGVNVQFRIADAHTLPFENDSFDVVISECTTCILHKEKAIREMARVTIPGGYVGIHDICWSEATPDNLKRTLAEIEGENPETLEGWKNLFKASGLAEVAGYDRSDLVPGWTKGIKRQLGLRGQLKVFLKAVRNWGIRGLVDMWRSTQIFQSKHTRYGIIVGRKP
jgi:SAM-dependent methyltransferase